MKRSLVFLACWLVAGAAALAVSLPAWALDEPALSADEREQLRQQIREAHRQRMHARHQLDLQRAKGTVPVNDATPRFGAVERARVPFDISQDERVQLRHQLREHQGHAVHGARRADGPPGRRSDAAGLGLPARAEPPPRPAEPIVAREKGRQ